MRVQTDLAFVRTDSGVVRLERGDQVPEDLVIGELERLHAAEVVAGRDPVDPADPADPVAPANLADPADLVGSTGQVTTESVTPVVPGPKGRRTP